MKKSYIQPEASEIVLNAELMLVPSSVSSTEAASGDVGFSREVDFDIDGEY